MATRNVKGSGNIRERNDGRWEGRYYDPISRKQHSVYGKTAVEVRKKLTKIQSEIDSNTFVFQNNTTLDELINYYFAVVKQYKVKPQTLSGYRLRYENLFKKEFGGLKVKNITEYELQMHINKLVREGKSKSYIKSGGVIVKEVLEYALKKKMIYDNPMRYVNYNVGKDEQEKRELSDVELHWFFRGLKERYGRAELMFKILLYTGMRVSEVCALRWKNISKDFKFITVISNITKYRDENGQYIKSFCTPKTKGSKRTIPIVEHLQKEVQLYKDECKEQFKRYGLTMSEDNLVFIPDIGEDPDIPYDRGRISNIIRTNIKYVEKTYNVHIEDFTPHYFRHKFISVAVKQQMSLKDLMSITGHTEVKTVMKYAHTQNKHLLESINKLPKMYD